MYKIVSIAVICAALSFAHLPFRNSSSKESTVSTDTVPNYQKDPEKWAPITQADAQNLAKEQGDIWKKASKEKNILMGLGPDGPDKLKKLLNSSDPTSKSLLTLLLQTADASLSKPIPEYKDPSQAISSGQTAVVAGNEEWMRPWGDEMVLLSVAAKVGTNPAYKQRLHDLVLSLCKFRTWGTRPLNADLAAGHVSRGIAMAWNWNPDLWTGNERKLIIDTIRSKVNMLCKGIYSAYWAGLYAGNHNQVGANGAGFCGVAFLNDIPEAKEWLAASWLNFKKVVDYSYADGSSAEGTAYWAATISFILQYIEGMNGILPSYTLYESSFLKNAAAYRINNSAPGYNGVIAWGDSFHQDFSGPENYLLRLSTQYDDKAARFVATHTHPGCGGGDDVKAWAWLWSQPPGEEKEPSQMDYYANVSDIINSRSGWKDDDYVLSFKSGFTNRSHSHLDAGSFALVVGNDWLLPTSGYGRGHVNNDFWDRNNGRWQYWSNSTEANTTLVINKGQQRHDNAARGTIDHFSSYDNAMLAECDLTDAYDGVNSVRRRIFHRRGEYIIVHDAVKLKAQGQVEWLLQTTPNSVVNDNTVNIQGKTGSVDITMLSPVTSLSVRDPVSPKNDMWEIHKTLAASVSGKNVGFIAAIEPKIHGREYAERTYSVAPDGTVQIKSAGMDEHLMYAEDPAALTDKNASAVARFMYVKSSQDKLSEVIVTDASKISAAGLNITGDKFSGDLVKSGGSWKFYISAGKNISTNGSANVQLIKIHPDSSTGDQ